MYDDHFGLTGRPFQLTPDPHFWFETATHRKAMAYLGYGLAQGEGFIVITGDIGAGKTTLMGHLTENLDPAALNVIKLVSTAIHADDLLRIVATALGVDPDGLTKAQLLTVIERGLLSVARTGRRTLLVVDEVQALPVDALEELRMLSNFQAGGHALLQIVLLGQPEFRDRLHGSERLEQLRQRVIAIHHLDPMEEHEVADYIAHRLTLVGWTGRPDFAADAFAALYQGSGGVPRRLNLLAGRVMLHAAVENLDLIDGRIVRTVLRDLHADLPMMSLDKPPVAPPVAAPALAPAPDPVAEPTPDPVVEYVAPEPEPEEEIPARRFVPSTSRWLVIEGEPEPEPEAVQEVGPEPVESEPVAEQAVEPEIIEPEAVEAEPVAAPEPVSDNDRLAALEARIEEQDAALRRVLTLLVDWVEGEGRNAASVPLPQDQSAQNHSGYAPIRGAAAWGDAA